MRRRLAAGEPLDAETLERLYRVQHSEQERKALGSHLTFSQGPSTCPGAGISRPEQQLAWQRLCERLDDIEFAQGNSFEHQPGIMLGTLALSLRFSKSA